VTTFQLFGLKLGRTFNFFGGVWATGKIDHTHLQARGWVSGIATCTAVYLGLVKDLNLCDLLLVTHSALSATRFLLRGDSAALLSAASPLSPEINSLSRQNSGNGPPLLD